MKTTNFLLTVITLLLATIVYQLHQQRPVTLAELQALAAAGDEQALAARREQIPLARIDSTDDSDNNDESDDAPATNSTPSSSRAHAEPISRMALVQPAR